MAASLGAHPRVGGEDCVVRRVVLAVDGSPPRRRGRLHVWGDVAGPVGLTPA